MLRIFNFLWYTTENTLLNKIANILNYKSIKPLKHLAINTHKIISYKIMLYS